MNADIVIGEPRAIGRRVMQLAAMNIPIVGDLDARVSDED